MAHKVKRMQPTWSGKGLEKKEKDDKRGEGKEGGKEREG